MKKKPPRKVKNDISEPLRDLDRNPEHLRQLLINSLLFIYDVVEHVHTHVNNESRLAKLITEEFQIKNLIKRRIIDLERHKALIEANGIFLNSSELEFSCLRYYGFSSYLLSRVYAHNNSRSINIRNYRLRTKIRQQMALEYEYEEVEKKEKRVKEEVFDF